MTAECKACLKMVCDAFGISGYAMDQSVKVNIFLFWVISFHFVASVSLFVGKSRNSSLEEVARGSIIFIFFLSNLRIVKIKLKDNIFAVMGFTILKN